MSALPDETVCTVWTCQVGVLGNLRHLLPHGADAPMREAIERRFARVLGMPAEFTFSGWGQPLSEEHLAVAENREPVYERTDYAKNEELIRLRDENERLRNAMAQIEARAVLMQRGVWSQSAVGNMGRALDGIARRSLATDENGEPTRG